MTGKTRLAFLTSVCAACLAPGLALAQEKPAPDRALLDGEVQAGVGYNSEDSFKFGEYTGLSDAGVFPILNWDLIYRTPYASDDTDYVVTYGNDLGLDSREAYLEYGQQGRFNARVFYDKIPHNLIDGALTPYQGGSGALLTLPSSFTKATSTGAMNLDETARPFDIENERERFGGGIGALLGPNWHFDVDYQREERSGTRQISGIFGVNGGNPASAALPEPIDYEVDEVTGRLGYTGKVFQAEFIYDGSFFNQNNEALRWENAYSGSPGSAWPNPASPFGQIGLPPDNYAHNFSLVGGVNLGQVTRLSGKLRYGIAKQDETFLPFTINPAIATPTDLPRNSLDGEVETMFADLRFSTRPTRDTDLRAEYRYEDRDNNTPRAVYSYVPSDTGNQGGNGDRINLPYSFEEHEFDLEGGYRFASTWKATLGYNFERIERTFAERDHTNEHTGRIRVRGRPFSDLTAWAQYEHGERGGDDYQGNAPFLASNTAAGAAAAGSSNSIFLSDIPGDPRFENHPLIRKINLADRSRDRIKASGTYTATRDLALTLGAEYVRDDFDDSELGVQERETIRATIDANYIVTSDLTTYAFYTYERFEDDLRGHQFRPFSATLTSLTDPAQRWTRDSTDNVNTLGAGFNWKVLDNKLEIGADYIFSKAVTEFDFESGADLSSGPLEDLESTLHQFDVTADYHWQPNWTIRLGYRFEYFKSNDFALDGVGVDSLEDVITFGNDSPDYTAHVVGVSLVAKF